MGMVGVMATYDVTGPTKDGVVVCKFTGRHGTQGGTVQAGGWITYSRVPDLDAGETTRGTCSAIAIPPLGDEPPSQPVVSLTTRSALATTPQDWQAQYDPPTPWP